jgi:hypothetical protein
MKPKGILMVWFAVMTFWAAASLLAFTMTLLVAIVPDSRTSPLMILGIALVTVAAITTAVSVRRVTRWAGRATRAFGVLSGGAIVLMAMGTTTRMESQGVVQALASGWLIIGLVSWWIARRIDRAVDAAR